MSADLILAFDTASDNIALAVGRRLASGEIVLIAANDHWASRQANVQLMPSIDALFAANGLSKSDVLCVVSGLGPGSFTGVRIGVTTAKGIARGLGVPLYGVSTLDAVAWGAWLAGTRGKLGVVADAMRGEVYPARYELDETGARRLDPHTVAKADAVATCWDAAGVPLLLIGDGLKKFASAFVSSETGSDKKESQTILSPPISLFTLGDEALWIPTGAGLLRCFSAAWASNTQGTGDAATLLPVYTRLSDAEENERKRLATGGQLAQGALVEVPLSGVADPAKDAIIAYRPMAETDLERVCALEEESFSGVLGISGEKWTRGMFADDLARKDRSWWVACQGDELLGFAGGWVIDGDLQILDVAVVTAHRRRGIASILLQRLFQDAVDLGATKVSLEVRESNTAAQALYASLGFEQEGLRSNYYAPQDGSTVRENAVIMSNKELAPASYLASYPASYSPLGRQGGGQEDRSSGIFDRSSHASLDPSFGISRPSSPLILAIETSCDETAAAVMAGAGDLLSNTVASQIDFHARFGGVVPEIASRKHTEAIVGVVDAALEEAGLSDWQDLDALAVTYAPGLIGALVVGLAFAKGLSWATGLPLIRVNHLEGHIYANKLAEPSGSPIEPPFIVALLSGGHTMLVHVRAWGEYHILGQTLDDAVGEAFDKVAKALGLGYPGGPVISKLAEQGDARAIAFPRALLHSHDYHFSLSGLKTAVIMYIKKEQESGRELKLPDIAASFQQAVIDVQVAKALTALEETGCTTFCLGGGVAANKALRDAYAEAMQKRKIRVVFPPSIACTDNAAMIALVAQARYAQGNFATLSDDAFAHVNLEEPY